MKGTLKKVLAFLLTATLLALLAGCGGKAPDAGGGAGSGGEAGQPNPMVQVDGPNAFLESLGLILNVPSGTHADLTIADTVWNIIDNEIGQADFNASVAGGEAAVTLRIKKAAALEDISGVYDEYAETATETFPSSKGTPLEVEIRATEGTGAVATWYNPDTGAAYSASFSQATGGSATTLDLMKQLVKALIALN
jgi:hypothetical protein